MIRGPRGFTLTEMVVGAGALVLVMTIIIPVVLWQMRETRNARLTEFVIETQARFVGLLQNKAAWGHTISGSAGLDCDTLNDGTTSGVLTLRDSTNGIVYDPVSSPANGLDYHMRPCNGFNAAPGAGSDSCPFRLNLKWEAVCATCAPAMVRVRGEALYNPATPIGFQNARKLEFSMLKTLEGVGSFVYPTEVAVSRYSACAVMSGGGVKCWGSNNVGQLGNGTYTNSSVPVDVVGLGGKAVMVTVSDPYTGGQACAILESGVLRCWGTNSRGQMGQGTVGGTFATPLTVPMPGPVSYVSLGFVNCASLTNGDLYCWGANDNGNLGNGTIGTTQSTPLKIALPGPVKSFRAGQQKVCAATTANRLFCWGLNKPGVFGVPEATVPYSYVPYEVDVSMIPGGIVTVDGGYMPGDTEVVSILAGDGTVWAWGENRQGQLGRGDWLPSHIPQRVSGLNNVTNLNTSGRPSCAVVDPGDVYCWGHNDLGQLGIGNRANQNLPRRVSLPVRAKQVAATNRMSCAYLTDNRIFCWGDNSAGQLGNGTTTSSLVPVEAMLELKCE